MYAEKTYYVPHYHKVIYCHAYDGEFLILSGLCNYVDDAKKNIIRQKLHKSTLWTYEFKQLDFENLGSFPYLTNADGQYCVTGELELFGNDYLIGSVVMADEGKDNKIKISKFIMDK